MSVLPSAQPPRRPFNAWEAAFTAIMLALIAMAAVLGLLGYKDLRDLGKPQDDAGWTIFQMGFEHERLLLAAETAASLDELRLRGDIYLSRVFLLRDAPMLENVRDNINEQSLLALFQSAQKTDRLIDQAGQPGGRQALLQELRDDAKPVRELMIDMSNLNRRLQTEERMWRTRSLLFYLTALELLLAALMALGIYVLRTSNKLRDANQEIAGQLETQDAILRSVDDVIIGVCDCGTVLYSNPRAVELLGPSAASGATLPGAGEGVPELASQLHRFLAQPFPPAKDGLLATEKVKVEGPEGTSYYVMRKFRSVAAQSRHCTGDSFIVSIADVTAAEEATQRREDYDARIGEISRLLAYAAISGGIVHEISQPLAAIRNYVYALKVSFGVRPGSEDQKAIADHLGTEVDRAIEVVRNVRRMGPQDPQDPGVCDIAEAIQHSLRLVTLGRNPPPPVTVKQPDEAVWVLGSLPLIGQVLVNLVKNALSASDAAGRPGALVSVGTADGFARIEVEDFGTGVSADAARTIFTPFSKSARGGMGLGLAICQRIASTLGGSLSWQNREGAGAVFTFTVPLAKEDNPQ